jgi:uncharacterized protein
MTSIAWSRLDVEGQDRCSLQQRSDGWSLQGRALFDHDSERADLEYGVLCNPHWRTRSAWVRGAIGHRRVAIEIEVDAAYVWRFNGNEIPAVRGCIDVDLSFTPATNLLPLRRLDLQVGDTAQATAAWLAFPNGALEVLEQRYTRIAEDAYAYAAPRLGYVAELRVNHEGFVIDYPGLWRAAARPDEG